MTQWWGVCVWLQWFHDSAPFCANALLSAKNKCYFWIILCGKDSWESPGGKCLVNGVEECFQVSTLTYHMTYHSWALNSEPPIGAAKKWSKKIASVYSEPFWQPLLFYVWTAGKLVHHALWAHSSLGMLFIIIQPWENWPHSAVRQTEMAIVILFSVQWNQAIFSHSDLHTN